MQAIILSGGKGERLSPFTNDCPKVMLKIEGKSIVEYQLEWLIKHKVQRIIFACGYLCNVIKDHFGDGKRFGIKIDYSIEDEPLGRGGAVKHAWDKSLGEEQIIVTNGDICTGMNLDSAIEAHNAQRKSKGIIATVCLFPYKSPYGIVRTNNDCLITGFDEKRALPYWVNGGIYIFEPDVKSYLPDKGDHEVTMFPELSEKRLLFAYKSYDYWKGIDTLKDLNEFALETKQLQFTK